VKSPAVLIGGTFHLIYCCNDEHTRITRRLGVFVLNQSAIRKNKILWLQNVKLSALDLCLAVITLFLKLRGREQAYDVSCIKCEKEMT